MVFVIYNSSDGRIAQVFSGTEDNASKTATKMNLEYAEVPENLGLTPVQIDAMDTTHRVSNGVPVAIDVKPS